MLGGLLVVFAVALWHRAFVVRSAAEEAEDLGCRAEGALSFCGAAAKLSTALHNPMLNMKRAQVLPPAEAPGAVDPAITQSNIDTTICRPGFARSARPSYALTGPLKRQMMDAQRPGERMADYELDHLIPTRSAAHRSTGATFGFSPAEAKQTPATRMCWPTSSGAWSASVACRSRRRSERSAAIGRRPTRSTPRQKTSRATTSGIAKTSATSSAATPSVRFV